MDTDTEPDQYSINITKIIKHSLAMLKHAEAGEWEIVAEEELVRRRLINDFFSQPSNITSEPHIDVAIQELLQVNDKLERLSVAARDEARSAIDSIKTGRTAVNAYRDNSR